MMIKTHGFDYNYLIFPAGEPQIRITYADGPVLSIDYEHHAGNDLLAEIFIILQLADALKPYGGLDELTINYCPFGRQDRRAVEGDTFALKVFADLINTMELPLVELMDPHSPVASSLIKNSKVIPQHEVLLPYFKQRKDNNFYLVSPDDGAITKTHLLHNEVGSLGVLQCSKKRDPHTGKLSGFTIPEWNVPTYSDLVIVDDICDGGGTFIGLAQELRRISMGKIILVVSHGLFTNGLELLNNHLNEVWVRGKRVI